MYDDRDIKYEEGKLVTRVQTDDSDATITFDDGTSLMVHLEGDCCSDSFFTDQDQFTELEGSKILSVERRGSGDHTPSVKSQQEPQRQEESSWAFLVFITDKGHVTIDWRNDSNGYYGGWVTLSEG